MHGHQKKPELTKFYSLFKLTALCALFHEAAAVRRQTPPLAPDYSSLPPVALPHGLTDAMQEPLF